MSLSRPRPSGNGGSSFFAEAGARAALLLLLLSGLAGSRALAQGDYQKGLSYYQQKQYRKAIAEFEAIVKQQPRYEFGHRILGLAFLKTRQYDRAIASFREAIKLKGDVWTSYSGLALAYFNSGRYSETLDTLNRAAPLARSPRDQVELYRTRGAAAFNSHQYQLARLNLERAIAFQRSNPDDLVQLGIACYRLQDREKAKQYLQQALQVRPQDEEALRFLAQIQYETAVAAIENKQYKEGAELLKVYLEKHQQDAGAWFNLGLSYLFTKNLKAAEAAFLRTVRIEPGNGAAHDRLGYVYEMTRRYKLAQTSYQKALDLTGKKETRLSLDRIKKRIARGG